MCYKEKNGEPAICQCCKMSMMQNDNDAKCQWYIYVNVAKCQCLQNDNIKNRKCSATVPTLPYPTLMEGCMRWILYVPHITFKQF